MIITLTLNPAIDKTVEVKALKPGELVRVNSVREDAGGKGINVSKTIHALNSKSAAMGFLGKENPAIFEKCFWNYSIENGFLFVNGPTRTNIKITEPDGRLTELNEPGFIISKADQERLLEQVYRRADKYTLFVLSGSLPKGADPDLYAKIIVRIHNKGGAVILDSDQDGFAQALEQGPAIVKPNLHEMMEYYHLDHEPQQKELIQLGRQMLEKGPEMVCISAGGMGALLVTKDHAYRGFPPHVIVRSSVGAGDAMVAALAVARERKLNEVEAFRMAVAVSAGACETEGTQPPEKERIKKLLEDTSVKEINM
jgi:1-phosphofructokinase